MEGSNTVYYEPIIKIIVTNEIKADKIHVWHKTKKFTKVWQTLHIYKKKPNDFIKMVFKFKIDGDYKIKTIIIKAMNNYNLYLWVLNYCTNSKKKKIQGQ